MRHLTESILSGARTIIDKTNKQIKNEIIDWIVSKYSTYKTKISIMDKSENGVYLVNISGDIKPKDLTLTQLTNGLFKFNEIRGSFRIDYYSKLISLEGAPKKVDGDFSCTGCKSLTSLKNAPIVVGGDFRCYGSQIKKLEWMPEEIGGGFYGGIKNHITVTQSEQKDLRKAVHGMIAGITVQ